MNLRDLKQEIIKITPQEYKVKTNFSCSEFLVEVGNFIIIAEIICTETEVYYEFVLDTQFVREAKISYEEIIIIKNVIELLNKNKKLAISRLKKWTVEEYLKDKEERKIRHEKMLESLKEAIMKSYL